MKTGGAMLVAVLGFTATVWTPIGLSAQTGPGEAFAGGVLPASMEANTPPSDIQDYSLYQDGTRAINEGRWSDAVTIFSKIADQKSAHAQGALYWKAYAENKQGQTNQALETCAQLRKAYDGSAWNDECGALEIEILNKSGQPIHLNNQMSDDLKLLTLFTLMQHDEKKALDEIEQILNGDSSEKLKQGALFILSQHHTDTVYPQVVRISYVEGDVRVTRGEENKKSKGATWEKAVVDLPLETGFSLVTGEGRAEVEFENASILYLGENSVLTFNDLHTSQGIPHSEVALLSGTATLHIKPYVPGELFELRTPTDTLQTWYPQATNLRISSYVDGIGVAPAGQGAIGLANSVKQSLAPGQTLYFKDGVRIMDAGPVHPPDFSAWDQWVAERYAQREAVQAFLMKEAGLNSPIPGLTQMQGQGTFVKCEPYGTCWEPKEMPQSEPAGGAQAEAKPEAQGEALAVSSQVEPGQTAPSQAAPGQTTAGRNIRLIGKPMPNASLNGAGELYALMPCLPYDLRSIYGYGLTSNYPWNWAICNSGSWIYYQNRYMWVAGRCHHHPPIHWVRYGKEVAFVPYHPHDIRDRPPVNLKNGLFAVNMKQNRPIERIPVTTPHSVDMLKEAPKPFRVSTMPLAPAGEPRLEAYHMKDSFAARGTPVKPTGIPMSFNHHTQSFMMPTLVMRGTHTTTVMAPVSNHAGNLQAHTGSFAGGGSHSYGGGGGSHGYAGGGGGASHGGGGGGASAGGSHGGGGSSGGSASGGASSGGGSHH